MTQPIVNRDVSFLAQVTLSLFIFTAGPVVVLLRQNRRLTKVTKTLQNFAMWSLGQNLVTKALEEPNILSLQRQKRTILFIDIRGFTRWSMFHQPEHIVSMLNGYYLLAEQITAEYGAIQIKFTADEVLATFMTSSVAMQAALALQQKVNAYLSTYDLSAGIGLNTGVVVEGLLGGQSRKEYDVIGASVNVAKCVERATMGGALTIAQDTYKNLESTSLPPNLLTREIVLQDTNTSLAVYTYIAESDRRVQQHKRGQSPAA